MCVYDGFRYSCGHTVYKRRSTCWGWFWAKLHYIDCCYSFLTCTGGVPPDCEPTTQITDIDMKCFGCQEEEIKRQKKRGVIYPRMDSPPTFSEPNSSHPTPLQPSSSQQGTGGFRSQQGMQYPTDPPVPASQRQMPLPSPAVRESQSNRGEGQNLGTKVLSPRGRPDSHFTQGTAYHGHRSQSSDSSESRSRRRHSSQGPGSASHRSQRSRSLPRGGNRSRPRRESTSQEKRPQPQSKNSSRIPTRRGSTPRSQQPHSQKRDGSRSRQRRESTSRDQRPPLSSRGRPPGRLTYYNDPTPVRRDHSEC